MCVGAAAAGARVGVAVARLRCAIDLGIRAPPIGLVARRVVERHCCIAESGEGTYPPGSSVVAVVKLDAGGLRVMRLWPRLSSKRY